MLLNELNKRHLKYEIRVRDYYWFHRDETGKYQGIRIIVDLDDRYKVSIIQAFNDATGDFYGTDIWEMAFIDTKYGWDLLHEFEFCGMKDSVYICKSDELIENIDKFIKKRLET